MDGPEDIETPPPEHVRAHPLFHGKTSIGLITADKPRFPTQVEGGNDALKAHLDAMGLKHEGPTPGQYDDHENSFIIHGPTREQMQDLGKKFGQESVIYTHGLNHELHYTNGVSAGSYVAGNREHPISHFSDRPSNYWTALPGSHSFVRLNFDPNWEMRPSAAAGQPQPQSSPGSGSLIKMSTKQFSLSELGAAVVARLRKAEADLSRLHGRELRKDEHMEPGVHEAAQPGAASHQEPGGHEQYAMGMPDTVPTSPVGSSAGVPPSQLADPSAGAIPTGADPQADMAGVDTCITCGQPDAPGQCTCLGNQDQLMAQGAHAQPNVNSGGPTPLALSEKSEPLMKPPVSEAQRRAMGAAAGGNSTLGIPKGVGKEFIDADKGGKLPKVKKGDESAMPSANLAMGESSVVKAEMCKNCGYEHVPGQHKMKKEEDYVNVNGKKKTVGLAPKAKLPPKGPDNDIGANMEGSAVKEMSPAGSGGEIKKGKTLGKAEDKKLKITLQGEDKASSKLKALHAGIKPKPVSMEASPDAERKSEESMAKAGLPPMAKPPGTSPVAAAPTAKVGAPKVAAPKLPAVPKPLGKALNPMAAQMKGGGATHLTSPNNPARANEHAAALGGAFTPKGPVVSGLELAPKKPAGPGLGAPKTPAAPYAHIFGKSERCPFCNLSEHPGTCK